MHTHGHRQGPVGIALVGTEQHQIAAQLCRGITEESVAEVFATPGSPTAAVLGIKIMHAHQQLGGNLLPHQRRDLHTGGGHSLAFAANITALVGIEPRQISLKINSAIRTPAALLVQPQGAASGLS